MDISNIYLIKNESFEIVSQVTLKLVGLEINKRNK
jgi:hypothetical protein